VRKNGGHNCFSKPANGNAARVTKTAIASFTKIPFRPIEKPRANKDEAQRIAYSANNSATG
jgi:hypothetical protein